MERPLVSLDLECCHLDTKASRFNWGNIPFGWENLQRLNLRSTAGLSIEMVHGFLLKLKNVKKLSLPPQLLISEDHKKLLKDLERKWLGSPSKCQLDFNSWRFSHDKV